MTPVSETLDALALLRWLGARMQTEPRTSQLDELLQTLDGLLERVDELRSNRFLTIDAAGAGLDAISALLASVVAAARPPLRLVDGALPDRRERGAQRRLRLLTPVPASEGA